MILRLLAFLGRHGTRVLALGILTGLALPDLAAALRPHLTAVVVCTLIGSLLRLEWRDVVAQMRAWPRVVLATGWLILVSPVLVFVIARFVPLPPGLVTAMVLSAAGPCIMASPAIAILLGLDGALTLVVMVLAHLLVPLTVPPIAAALVGVTLELGIVELMLRLAAIVFGAALIAQLIRRLAGAERIARHARAVDGVNMVVLVVFAIAIMDGVTQTALREPGLVVTYLLAALVFNAGLQAVGALAFRRTGPRSALAVGFMAGNRNMGLMWAALGPDTPIGITLYFAVAQLPMYLFPAFQSALYRRWRIPPG